MPRPRKSIEQHLLDGTYRKDRHGPIPKHLRTTRKPVLVPPTAPPVQDPGPPVDLSEKGQQLWDAVSASGIGLAESDRPALELLCSAWVQVWQCAEDLKGATVVTRRHLLSAWKIAVDGWVKLACQFGLTPSDRAKLMLAVGPKEEAAPKVETRPRTRMDSAPPPNLKIAGA